MTIPIAAAVSQVTTDDDPMVSTALQQAPEAARAALRTAASRSTQRLELTVPVPRSVDRTTEPAPEPEPEAEIKLSVRWTTARLNVWSRPGEGSRLLTVLDTAVKVLVTGTVDGAWAEVDRGDRTAWVRKAYLVPRKPKAPAVRQFAGVSGSPCPDGSSVETGLQPNTVKVYRAVCAAFPAVSAWGGRSGSGNHGAGLALDIMASGSLGEAIAEYVRSQASAFGVSDVIFAQRIWTPLRSSEGWRAMEDRGSTTANHYDHVHVSVS